MSNADPKRVVTGRVRLSYCHLTTPRAQNQGDKLKYSATLLIPKSDVATRQKIDQAINAAIQEGIASRWNGQRPAQPAVPVYDGDGVRPTGEPFSEECRGHWVMTASSEQRPEVVDLNLNPILNASDIYSGMFARASIRFFAYANSGKKGIGCGLNNVQKLEDGEPLGGRTNAANDFGDNAGYAPAAPAYQAPTYPQQPTYAPPAQPVYPQQPAYAPPAQPGYAAPAQPTYGQPVQPGYTPAAPVYPQQPGQPAQPVQYDPITGLPVIPGGVMGI